MTRKNRPPEGTTLHKKIRELLMLGDIGNMDNINNLFKETIAEFNL